MARSTRLRGGIVVALVMALFVAITSPASAFDDVPATSFSGPAINWMTDQAITTGTSATSFSPDREITRAEFATLLWRFSGSPKPAAEAHAFSDSPVSGPFATAIKWVAGAQIARGTTKSTFAPNAAISRAEAVTYMWRYACRPTTDVVPSFEDVIARSFYADAVAWAKAEGIANGRSSAIFDPNATLTRGESATLLWRLAGKPASGAAGANRSTKMPGCNQAPIAIDDTFETDEVTPIFGNVLVANPAEADSDPDGDAITVTASSPDIVESDGRFKYDPATLTEELADGETATIEVMYTISDPAGLTDTATATITVTGLNDAPILDEIEAITANYGETVTFTATATDPEAGPLTFTLVDEPQGAAIHANGEFSWVVPGLDNATVFTFDVVVTDNGGNSDTKTVQITVEGACIGNNVGNGLNVGECYVPADGATVQELALAACESHFGVGECSIIVGGYSDMQYGRPDLGGDAGSIHWHWDNHPTGHCGPEYKIGDVVAPGWCGEIVGNFLSGLPG